MSPRFQNRGRARGFTLIELLLAVAIFSIVLIAINTVFYSAVRLRARVVTLLDHAHSVNRALGILRRDLRGVMPPSGPLALSFKIGPVTPTQGALQVSGIEFFSATGVISDEAPYGDIQKITYLLRDPVDRNSGAGKDLVRSVCRNLLATAVEVSVEERLLGEVSRMEISCYTGTEWRELWDTTQQDTGLPSAVRVRLYGAAADGREDPAQAPIELLIPFAVQAGTNLTASTTGL